MRGPGRLAIGTLVSLLGASLLPATGAAQLQSTVPSLPSLTPALLLDIANVDMPSDEGIGLQVHADFPNEAPLLLDGLEIYSLSASITPEGNVVLGSGHTAQTASGGGETVEECSDDAFAPSGFKWAAEEMPIKWHMNRRSIPEEIKKDATVQEIRGAHRVWPYAMSQCTEGDPIDLSYNYSGLTVKHPGYDGVNSIDFGSLSSGALAVNHTWYSGTTIVEVDLRLNKEDYNWSNVAGVKRYQVKNVVTHELGHQVGLDDLGDPHGALTMFARIGKGERNKISLGRGDVRGAEVLSP